VVAGSSRDAQLPGQAGGAQVAALVEYIKSLQSDAVRTDRRKDLPMRLSEPIATPGRRDRRAELSPRRHNGDVVAEYARPQAGGVMFLVSVIFFFLIGGIFALLLRFKLLEPGPSSSTPSATTACSRCMAS